MLTLGFMLLPLVLITSREAILSVPDDYRDASAALGVSKWQTIRSVVLPGDSGSHHGRDPRCRPHRR